MKYILFAAVSIFLYHSYIQASTGISSCYSSDSKNEYMLGEPVANTSTGNMLTAGFLQGIISVVLSGVDDVKPDDGIAFKLFPNPVKAILRIVCSVNASEPDEDMEFSLFNNKGATAYRGTLKSSVNDIDLSHISPGIYIVCINNASGMKIFESKIIKNNE